jgi:hypothetical protein
MSNGLKMFKACLPCDWCGKPVKQHRARKKKYCDRECFKQKCLHTRLKQDRRYCANPDCLKIFWANKGNRKKCKYCSLSCASTINNRLYPKKRKKPSQTITRALSF